MTVQRMSATHALFLGAFGFSSFFASAAIGQDPKDYLSKSQYEWYLLQQKCIDEAQTPQGLDPDLRQQCEERELAKQKKNNKGAAAKKNGGATGKQNENGVKATKKATKDKKNALPSEEEREAMMRDWTKAAAQDPSLNPWDEDLNPVSEKQKVATGSFKASKSAQNAGLDINPDTGEYCVVVSPLAPTRFETTSSIKYPYEIKNSCAKRYSVRIYTNAGWTGYTGVLVGGKSTWFCTDGFKGNRDCKGGIASYDYH